MLPMFDRSYLCRIGSPFAKLLPGIQDDESVLWFYKEFQDELARYDSVLSAGEHFKTVATRASSHASYPCSVCIPGLAVNKSSPELVIEHLHFG